MTATPRRTSAATATGLCCSRRPAVGLPDSPLDGPQWHMSFAAMKQRVSDGNGSCLAGHCLRSRSGTASYVRS